jgi:hypothetical protein
MRNFPMKTIKTLLAVSVLTAVGAANAAVINSYDVSISGVTSGLATGTLTATGSAALDDAGILTIDFSALNNQPAAGGTFTTANHTVFNGTIAGGSFTATSGSNTYTSCTAGTAACPGPITSALNIPQPLTATPATGNGGGLFEQAFVIAGGTNTSTAYSFNHLLVNNLTYTFTPSAIPVPAAAWLFGSGLLGLAGTARRRRSAA